MAGKKDIVIKQGATFKYDFTLEQYDADTDQYLPVDLGEAEARMQIRDSHRSDRVLLDLTAGGYIFIEDAPNGVIRIFVPSTVTSELDFTVGVYDIEVDFVNAVEDNVLRIVEGRVIVSPEVTR